MSRWPFLDPAAASTVLALVSAARAHCPEAPLAWLSGYAARAAGEPVIPPYDPRAEPPGPAHTAALARMPLTRRP